MVDILIKYKGYIKEDFTLNGEPVHAEGHHFELSGVTTDGKRKVTTFLAEDNILKERLDILEKEINKCLNNPS